MCIDSSLSWTDDANIYYTSLANSLRRGHGFVVGNTACSFKFFGMPSNQATVANLGDKYGMYNHLTRAGTQFRIIGDPTSTVYTIVNVNRGQAIFNKHVGSIGSRTSYLETINFDQVTDGIQSSPTTE